MILLPRAVRVYIATQPVNLRKSFDGLTNEIRMVLERDPVSGHVFAFLNRRRTQVKLVLWTRGGFTIVHKRLERGTFSFPKRVTSESTSVEIDVHELGDAARRDRRGARSNVQAMGASRACSNVRALTPRDPT